MEEDSKIQSTDSALNTENENAAAYNKLIGSNDVQLLLCIFTFAVQLQYLHERFLSCLIVLQQKHSLFNLLNTYQPILSLYSQDNLQSTHQ